ncbi:hypothetical protein CR513_04539, partial [Mucuna pruriens]
MATANFVQPAIPRFDGHYDHWSMLMENFLRSKEYWQVVSDEIPDLKGKNYLFQAIDHPILETILCKDTSKDIWDSMKKKYQGFARAKRQQLQTLRLEFETLRMKSGESVTDYFSRTMTIVNKMRIHGDKTKDITVVEKILRSMTPKFNFVDCSIEEAHDIEELSIDELQKEKEDEEKEEVKASKAETREAMIMAINKNINNTMRINSIEEEEVEEAITLQLTDQSQQTNTGCNNHMCGNKMMFSDLDETFCNTVKFGDNSIVFVLGKGMFPQGKSWRARKTLELVHSNICETHEIKRQLTAAYTPQQNGVCERKNHTIMYVVRSPLTRSGVPKTFWPEAVN